MFGEEKGREEKNGWVATEGNDAFYTAAGLGFYFIPANRICAPV
jgi:hypothetical protein